MAQDGSYCETVGQSTGCVEIEEADAGGRRDGEMYGDLNLHSGSAESSGDGMNGKDCRYGSSIDVRVKVH